MKLKLKVSLIISVFIMMLCLTFIGINPIRAHAAGNSNITSVYMNEITTIVNHSKNSTTNNTYYVDEKIQIYSGSNNGDIYKGDSVYVDSNNIYIDYTTGNGIAYHPVSSSNDYTDTFYRFEILDSSNKVKWFTEFNMSTYETWAWFVTTTHYVKEVKVNGTTKTIDTTTKSNAWLVLTEFGKNSLYLSDGTYKLNLSRKYDWKKDGNNYSSTVKASGYLYIDTQNPTISMVDLNNNNIANNSYVNSNVKVSFNDKNDVIGYVKYPSYSYAYTFKSGSSFGGETGWYEFYSVDKAGNKSNTVKFYYDDISPRGDFYVNGNKVPSGSYIKDSFSYSGYDQESGISDIYYLAPEAKGYVKYTNNSLIPTSAKDGLYRFYCVDKAGNMSDVSEIFLEINKPNFNITRNSKIIDSLLLESDVRKDIYINENDVLNFGYTSSSNVYESNFNLNEDITFTKQDYPLDQYELNVKTATGIKVSIVIHIVRIKPHIIIDNKPYYDSSSISFNHDVEVSYIFDETIINHPESKISIQDSNNKNYPISSFKSTLKAIKGEEIIYTITLIDPAGNNALIHVYLNSKAPTGKWVDSDGKVLANNSITNKAVRLVYDDSLMAVYTLDHVNYFDYNGKSLSSDGTYYITLTDEANNSSTYIITIDTVAPIGHLYSNFVEVSNGSKVKGNLFFTYDEDAECKVNGVAYIKNTLLSEASKYTFVLTDKAGNSSTYSATLEETETVNIELIVSFTDSSGTHEEVVDLKSDKVYHCTSFDLLSINGSNLASISVNGVTYTNTNLPSFNAPGTYKISVLYGDEVMYSFTIIIDSKEVVSDSNKGVNDEVNHDEPTSINTSSIILIILLIIAIITLFILFRVKRKGFTRR